MPWPGDFQSNHPLSRPREAISLSSAVVSETREPRSLPPPEAEAATRHDEHVQYWLDYRGHRFELRTGELVLGRSSVCQLVLDDALVSRRHARLVTSGNDVRVEDLSSANGVYVNGDKISGSRPLSSGDRIVVGQQELVLHQGSPLRDANERQRYNAVTLNGQEVRAQLASVGEMQHVDDSDSTHQGDALTLLGGVAAKVLALGRGEEAERILGNFLTSILERARAGSRIEVSMADRAAEYAVKIASVTGKPRWVDFAVELFTLAGRPLPAGVVDQLYTVLRNVSGINRNGLRLYISMLRAKQDRLGPTERFLTQRIEGLDRLAALK